MKEIKKITALIVLSTTLLACTNKTYNIEPNHYTKEGYCIVNTDKQMQIGLNRFNTKEEFQNRCNGKMIFQFKENQCTKFTMKEMKFDIFIENNKDKYLFKIGEERTICGKTIIESINKSNL